MNVKSTILQLKWENQLHQSELMKIFNRAQHLLEQYIYLN